MNIDDMTLGDLEDLEEATGMAFSDIESTLSQAGDKMPPIKVVKAIIWILRRKTDPAYTLADTASVKLTELAEMTDMISGTVDPTSAVSEPVV
jgi:hypothetical protein